MDIFLDVYGIFVEFVETHKTDKADKKYFGSSVQDMVDKLFASLERDLTYDNDEIRLAALRTANQLGPGTLRPSPAAFLKMCSGLIKNMSHPSGQIKDFARGLFNRLIVWAGEDERFRGGLEEKEGASAIIFFTWLAGGLRDKNS